MLQGILMIMDCLHQKSATNDLLLKHHLLSKAQPAWHTFSPFPAMAHFNVFLASSPTYTILLIENL